MPVKHYENFPVASIVLPPRMRKSIEAIYAFARSADDCADEGNHPATERFANLDSYAAELRMLEADGVSANPLFARLGRDSRAHRRWRADYLG